MNEVNEIIFVRRNVQAGVDIRIGVDKDFALRGAPILKRGGVSVVEPLFLGEGQRAD